jgi:hypothetical protein
LVQKHFLIPFVVLGLSACRNASSSTDAATTPSEGAPAVAGGNCSTLWMPAPNQSWLWDLDNAVVPVPTVASGQVKDYNAQIYDVDLFNSTPEQIASYHAAGKRVLCYVNVGAWEDARPDSGSFDPKCYCGTGHINSAGGCTSGSPHLMQGFPEWWFDVSGNGCTASIQQVLVKRIALAATKGCDGIEPDNTDSYNNNTGWTTTIAQQHAFNLWIADQAHAHCMSVVLKNGSDMLQNPAYAASLVVKFDGSLNEQCHQYAECDAYAPFAAAGKPMFNAEYPNTPTPSFCGTPGMKTRQYHTLAVEYQNLLSVCP